MAHITVNLGAFKPQPYVTESVYFPFKITLRSNLARFYNPTIIEYMGFDHRKLDGNPRSNPGYVS